MKCHFLDSKMKILFSCDRDDVCMFSFKSSALLCVCVRAETTRKTKSGGGGGVISARRKTHQVSTSVFTLFFTSRLLSAGREG